MKTRKTILLSAIVVLLCIYVIQTVNAGRNKIKENSLKESPDTITIENMGKTITLMKSNNTWLVGDKKYTADTSASENIADSVKTIKILDVVSHSDGDSVQNRYGFEKGKVITVTAFKDGKQIRLITIGKASSTGTQTYIRIDNSKDTCLVSGSYKDIFGKTEDALRSTLAYKFSSDDISDVKVQANGTKWEIAKSGNPPAWALISEGTKTEDGKLEQIDASHTETWIRSLAQLNVTSWEPDNATVPTTAPDAVVTFEVKGKDCTVTLYKETGKDDKGKETIKDYVGTCSETPYKFRLAVYMGEIFNKNLNDLKKK